MTTNALQPIETNGRKRHPSSAENGDVTQAFGALATAIQEIRSTLVRFLPPRLSLVVEYDANDEPVLYLKDNKTKRLGRISITWE